MRKLLNTLYITSPDKYLSLDGENIVVLADGKEAARVQYRCITLRVSLHSGIPAQALP